MVDGSRILDNMFVMGLGVNWCCMWEVFSLCLLVC